MKALGQPVTRFPAFLLMLLPYVVSPKPAAAADLTAPGKVTAVTVYADRAMVIRTVKIQLTAGEHALTVPGLPAGLAEDSLSAGVVTGPARLLGLDLRRQFASETMGQQSRNLEKEIQKLEDKIREITAKIEADKKAIEFADRLAQLKAEQPGKEFGSKPFNTVEWDAAVKFLTKTRVERNTSILGLEREKQETERQAQAKRSELNQLRSDNRETRSAVLLLAAKEGGEATLEVKYMTPGATWAPLYEARGDSAKKEVELTYAAQVIQQTGEDWNDVDLMLSTARPALGAQMPELTPAYLSAASIMPQQSYGTAASVRRNRKGQSAPAAAPAMREMSSEAGGDFPAPEPPPAAGWETSSVESSGVSAVYKIPRSQDVPSGDLPKRVAISVDKLPAVLSYETVPKLDARAFVRAKVKNSTNAAYLPGPLNVFLGGDFLGKSIMEPAAPGQEFTLSLGADDRIKIKRERIHEKTKDAFFSKKIILSNAFRITVENFTGARQTITVIDQIPVSQDASIEVREFEAKPAPAEKSEEKGELRWKLDLDHGRKQAIEFSYEIVFPEAVSIRPGARESAKRMQNTL